ncbi:S-adenosylmethionine synthetase superfamily [Penicillium macrosclerotiorum]|uniref:S-adenosylmethionine synthetase superfamily n=1 Tax=Penicillium macrosclerotiorum TaxID=303699 RepID=UPI002549A86A|nr:S-adenosylmethionine synthetase superfamily [Penicillium macrosclerotiorum]KAJ5688945.1 S-adenosylmethionine synthetase superfamily [Penicillium macrosclerotiorum]
MLLTTEPTESTFLFTSESVGEGHPDKVCDQIADAILDACLQQDPLSKVAIEAAARPGLIFVFGVLDTQAQIDIEAIVRVVLKDIGYESPEQELDYKTCQVMDHVERRAAPDFAAPSVFLSPTDTEAAGDQGIIFGYASNETSQSLPLTIDLSHRITRQMKAARLDGTLPWLLPDTKTQVTVEYVRRKNGEINPLRVHTIVLTAQHTKDVTVEELRQEVFEKVICKAVPAKFLDEQTAYHIQPTGDLGVTPSGKFAGVTGRKIVVDTYGGWGAHGGGAFSGKDYRQVDRSAAYMARWIAKSIIHAGLADRCLIQLSYSIGISEPLSIFVETYGTGKTTDLQLERIVSENFDMRPASIAKKLGLTSPIYYQTSKNGHFTNPGFPWEKPKDLVL